MAKTTIYGNGIRVRLTDDNRLALSIVLDETPIVEWEPVGPLLRGDSLTLTKIKAGITIEMG